MLYKGDSVGGSVDKYSTSNCPPFPCGNGLCYCIMNVPFFVFSPLEINFIHSFVRSFVRSFVHLFIHIFVLLLVNITYVIHFTWLHHSFASMFASRLTDASVIIS